MGAHIIYGQAQVTQEEDTAQDLQEEGVIAAEESHQEIIVEMDE